MATIHAIFTRTRRDEDGHEQEVGRIVVEAEFEPAASLRESVERARAAAWREALDHDALDRARREF